MPAARVVARALLLIALFAPPARAAWAPDGNLLTTFRANIAYPQLAPDGHGGVFATWLDYSKAPSVVRLSADGTFAPGWPGYGRLVAPWPRDGYLRSPTVVPDGLGGCYVVWAHAAVGCVHSCTSFEPGRIVVQRLHSSSATAPGWPREGLVVADRPVIIPWEFRAIPDGSHGLIIAADHWVQRVRPDASLAWGNGVEIETAGPSTVRSTVLADGGGGAYVFWTQSDTTIFSLPRVRGQHIDPDGSLGWGADGMKLGEGAALGLLPPTAISVGREDAVVSWFGFVGSGPAILATRVTPRGELAWRRESTVSLFNHAPRAQVLMVGAPQERVILGWEDVRVSEAGGFQVQVFAQCLDRNGNARWPENGAAVDERSRLRNSLSMASDGQGGAFFAWAEPDPHSELFATRIGADGLRAPTWPADGAPLCKAPASTPYAQVQSISMVSSAPGHAIVAWQDVRPAPPPGPVDADVSFAMRLDLDGPAAYARGEAPLLGPLASRRLGDPRVPIVLGLVPDPSSHRGRVRCTLPEDGEATIEVFDIAGRRVAEQSWVATKGAVDRELATDQALPAGLYLVRLRQRTQFATTRALVLP